MFDSTTAADIPAGSPLVMGYVYEPRAQQNKGWADADWLRFQGRTLVRLCIFNDRMDAQVIDIEPGNNDAAGAVPWVRGKWSRGETPTVYCFTDLGPQGYRISDVRAACDAEDVKRPLILITKFDNDPGGFDPAGDPEIIGKQYANDDLTGGHYDASLVADFWPGVDAPSGAPTGTLEEMTDDEFKAAYLRVVAPALEAEIQQRARDSVAEALKEAAAKLAQ